MLLLLASFCCCCGVFPLLQKLGASWFGGGRLAKSGSSLGLLAAGPTLVPEPVVRQRFFAQVNKIQSMNASSLNLPAPSPHPIPSQPSKSRHPLLASPQRHHRTHAPFHHRGSSPSRTRSESINTASPVRSSTQPIHDLILAGLLLPAAHRAREPNPATNPQSIDRRPRSIAIAHHVFAGPSGRRSGQGHSE